MHSTVSSRRAFTIIELLVVIVVVGILVAIAIPKFSTIKGMASTAQLRADLRNFATAEESYFYQNSVYASNAATLAPTFVASTGVTLTVVEATASGWSATATNDNTGAKCALFYNVAAVAPATADGQIACQ